MHVLYRGRPLSGALVKLTDLEHDAYPIEMHLTDEKGQAVFGARGRGAWLLNVIWTEVAPTSSDADFETTFSSLSFGHTSSSMNSVIAGPQDADAVSQAVARSAAFQPGCGK